MPSRVPFGQLRRVVTRRAKHDEVVEIQWTLEDGSIYWEHRTLPPPNVRTARLAVQRPREAGTAEFGDCGHVGLAAPRNSTDKKKQT